jgi:creatinine amidohydrolase
MTVGEAAGIETAGHGEIEVRTDRLSWAEIGGAIDLGKSTVIVVAASTEQHGPHLPTDCDAVYGIEMAVRAARRLGDALVAPAIRPGCSQHHMGFPGTITLPPETFVSTVVAYVRSLAAAGFKRIVLTSSHGGNFEPLSERLPILDEVAKDLEISILPVLDLDGWVAALRYVPDRRGLVQEVPVFAGDLIETSIMLAVRPETVDMGRVEVGYLGDFDVAGAFEVEGVKSLSANGILGDPRQASAELGAEIMEHLTEYLLAGIAAAEARP